MPVLSKARPFDRLVSRFGPYLVKVPKVEPFTSRSLSFFPLSLAHKPKGCVCVCVRVRFQSALQRLVQGETNKTSDVEVLLTYPKGDHASLPFWVASEVSECAPRDWLHEAGSADHCWFAVLCVACHTATGQSVVGS